MHNCIYTKYSDYDMKPSIVQKLLLYPMEKKYK